MTTQNDNINIFQHCRTCFPKISEQVVNIEALQSSDEMIALLTYLNIKVINGLPNVICIECIAKLDNILGFKKQCTAALASLNVIISNSANSELQKNVKLELDEIKEEQESVETGSYYENDHLESSDSDYSEEADEKVDSERKKNSNNLSLKNNHREKNNFSNHKAVCDICNKIFSDKAHLQRHKKIHAADRQKYYCNECKKSYSGSHGLRQHNLKFHNENPIVCTICNKRVDRLNRHMKIFHTTNRVKCEICDKFYKNNSYLQAHMRNVHTQKSKFYCDICKKYFSCFKSSTNHKRRFHSDDPLVCTICNKTIGDLKTHMDKVHVENQLVKCEYCNNNYKKHSLPGHINKMHRSKELSYNLCPICGMQCSNVKLHMRLKHSDSDQKIFKCRYCEKTFKMSGHQKSHERVSHLNERPFKCQYCNKAFGTKPVLINHLRTHTLEKPFICNICSRAFGQKSALVTHMKLVHKKLK